jgi:uncharacterized coiled-coil DUF342 family protein
MSSGAVTSHKGVRDYYIAKIDEKEIELREQVANLRRLQAQRNELNNRGTLQVRLD